jgi:hypothetical protein
MISPRTRTPHDHARWAAAQRELTMVAWGVHGSQTWWSLKRLSGRCIELSASGLAQT